MIWPSVGCRIRPMSRHDSVHKTSTRRDGKAKRQSRRYFRQGRRSQRIHSQKGRNMSDLVRQLRLGLVIADAIAVGEAVEACIRQLKHEDCSVRLKAAVELGRGLVTPAGAVDQLIEALHDPEWTVREAAVGALGYYWRQRRRAIPPLLGLLSDERVEVRRSAIVSLAKLGMGVKCVEDALSKLVRGPDAATGSTVRACFALIS